uniref:uncharacterized protein LOC122601488 n=1 Tax=Erigeron canadensis TaxID=72917 RepID=UPI001CB92903|nr:uncharacterized protein LOC122601488 [Erigeron canadensis]
MSSFSSQVPSLVKFSSDYFKGITFMVSSPKFVFVIGNMIILILFLHSKVFENNDSNQKDDMCYEYVKNCNNNLVNCTTLVTTTNPTTNKKKICRSKSENRIRVKCEGDQSMHKELRRSATDISKSKNDGYGDQVMEKSHVKEELSSEDFRLTVEAFIARQQKILRDEEFSPMVYIGS